VAAAAVALAGCSNRNAPQAGSPHSGNVEVTAGAGGVQAITITGTDKLRFDPSTFHVHPGKVRIVLEDTGMTPHDLTFTGTLRKSIPMTMHGQAHSIDLTVTKAGRYPFECSLHVRENMTGTMIVDAK